MLDETSNKKRRNLMWSSTVVLAAWFLHMKVPSFAAEKLHLEVAASEPWRIWALALALIVYQLWRFLTDVDVAKGGLEAFGLKAARTTIIIEKHLIRSLKRQLMGKRTLGCRITVQQPEIDWASWDTAEIYVRPTDPKIEPWPKVDPTKKSGTLTFGFIVFDPERRNSHRSTVEAHYQFGGVLWEWIDAKALAWSVLGTSELQDIFLPVVAALSAMTICAIRWWQITHG